MIKEQGFTLIEMMLVVGLLFLVISGSVMLYSNLLPLTDLHEASFIVKQQLRKARELSINGYNNTSHGVYVDRIQGLIIIYQGDSYGTRETSKDMSTSISSSLEIESTFPGDDVNFNKWMGMPDKVGQVIVSHRNVGTAEVELNRIGVVNLKTDTLN